MPPENRKKTAAQKMVKNTDFYQEEEETSFAMISTLGQETEDLDNQQMFMVQDGNNGKYSAKMGTFFNDKVKEGGFKPTGFSLF